MDFQLKYLTSDIKLSSFDDKLFKTEVVFDHHMLVWFISGETRIIQADSSYTFKAGDIFLIPRNQLATIINYPKDGLPHKSVVMHLSIDRLREYYSHLDVLSTKANAPRIVHFKDHPLLKSCLTSLVPYFDMEEEVFPEEIAQLKITEAISILRSIDKDIDNLLGNFDEPYKISLSDFMEKNFMFNMPLESFSYLTGRSLTTFKRDFHKTFKMTPQRWLTKKRLELAHYHITEKKRKPVEVYLETGFENLSHFSYVFKKHFGITPSALIEQST